jgi:hypothetical protein
MPEIKSPSLDGSPSAAESAGKQSRLIVRPDYVKGFADTASKKVDRYFYIIYLEECWECDGYRIGPKDLPDDHPSVHWTILLRCPVCHNNLMLDSTKKKLQVSRPSGLETAEPIRCSYKAEFGGLCKWSVVLESPRRREDKQISVRLDDNIVKTVLVDAVAKKA